VRKGTVLDFTYLDHFETRVAEMWGSKTEVILHTDLLVLTGSGFLILSRLRDAIMYQHA